MEGVAPQHESFFRQQVSLAAAALAAAASANAARSAPWRLRNKELGLSGVASSERLAFNHKLLNLVGPRRVARGLNSPGFDPVVGAALSPS
jgi:hypothetical protein